eukprot:CAMPEP_0118824496 /NCGR_PEP_ID=MMETSP1162-20130426/10645_1 /TAXON_ID=33656 /ORGANISM="Phaeocystis Sp, Strain CCMP2710" /LENGTH=94 /DNA_ID=CAMNT_0006755137 /DNA_START=544 /DNA_END=828 /DNA_ORIENTATION=+
MDPVSREDLLPVDLLRLGLVRDLGLIERLLALLPSVCLMLGAARHDRLHADRYLVRSCGAQKISHASLGHRREEDEDGEQGEEKVAREPCASHH